MSLLRTLLLAVALPLLALAGDPPPPPKPALLDRAGKIVAKLELTDTAQTARLTELVARHYEQLSLVHDQRDAALQLAKENSDQAAAERQRTDAHQIATGRLAALHFALVARLTAELTPAQVEAIKDGMTYGVAPNTFRVYQQMLPDLTPEQRLQIHAWLLEAREHAMQAGSSDEKHGWFGKYKGKINNYLSKAGYNMKDAEKNLKR
jgi:Spy/CpxP family protein refolding chaperone